MNHNTIRKYGAALLIAAGLVTTANAAFINGSISFAGQVNTTPIPNDLPNATGLTFSNSIVIGVAGDYSPVPTFTTLVNFNPVTFIPATPAGQLWSFTSGTTVYSFDLATMNVMGPGSDPNNSALLLAGTGFANITGFQPTPGLWQITANQNGQSFSFSAGSTAVPDGGTTLALLGGSLLGLGALRKRLRKL